MNDLRKRWQLQRLALERTIIILALGTVLAVVLVVVLALVL